jgi:hypothetical protein
MPSERTQPERQYGTEEVQEILQRAASLERQKKLERPMLSANEIETIAKESGLDPEMVKRAIAEFEVKSSPRSLASRLAGGPLKRIFEREVEGEITVASHESLAAEIRAALGSTSLMGQVSTVGRALTWTGYSTRGVIELNVFPRDGKTVIRLSSDTSQLAGGLFGGLIGGLGGGLGVNLAWILPVTAHTPWYAGAAGLVATVVGAWGLARTIYTLSTSSLVRRCEGLMDKLEADVRRAVKR